MKYILCEKIRNKNNAGSKARQDAEAIAIKNGYKKIKLFSSGSSKPIVAAEIIAGCFKAIALCKKGDTLLIQYPYYPEYVDRLIFYLIGAGKKIKKYKTILLIHDVISLRYALESKDRFNEKLSAEIRNMMTIDYIICHNASMMKLFSGVQKRSKFINLTIFDYLYKGEIPAHRIAEKNKVIIAGNLSPDKAGYLYKLPVLKNVDFCLYGNGYKKQNDQTNVNYKGVFPPEELILHLDGQYGLVWDGSSVDSCEGSSGLYLKYNNPHKMSLYLAAGLPVIIWECAALAEFVRSNGIGIVINSLTELGSSLSEVTEKEYNSMIQNVAELRKSLINGEYLTIALMNAV